MHRRSAPAAQAASPARLDAKPREALTSIGRIPQAVTVTRSSKESSKVRHENNTTDLQRASIAVAGRRARPGAR